MNRKNISIISMPPAGTGGSQTYARLLNRELELKNINIKQIKTYYVSYNWKIVKELASKFFSIIINSIKLSTFLSTDNKQIVHLYLGEKFSFWENAFYALICLGKKAPYIFHIHTNLIYDEYLGSSFIGKRIRDFFFKNTSKMIVLSNNLKKLLMQIQNFPESNIVVVHNFIDVDKYHQFSKIEARKKCFLPINKKIIFGLGRLIKDKNFSSLMLAIDKIRNENDKILCIIGGSGIEKNNLKALIKSKQLQQHVQLLGELDHEIVPLYMSSCDIFAITSFTEAFPMVILEALASGRPLVASNVGAIPEILDNEQYGLLVDPHSIDDIADNILTSMQKEWNEDQIVSYCNQHFSKKNVEKIINIYQEIQNTKYEKKLN